MTDYESSADAREKNMTLHYGVSGGKIVLMVTDDTGILHRISMTPKEWNEIVIKVPYMAEGEVKTISGHDQMR